MVGWWLVSLVGTTEVLIFYLFPPDLHFLFHHLSLVPRR